MVIPQDAISYAGAEHYGLSDTSSDDHIQAIGCTLISDEESPWTGYAGNRWEFLDDVESHLQVPEGGGILFNHPAHTAPTTSFLNLVKSMYNYKPHLVLGIEIYNHSREILYENQDPWAVVHWDTLLRDGYELWGFANPDYEARRTEPTGDWLGRSKILVANLTNTDCLRAYRKGQFYSALLDQGFEFDYLGAELNKVQVEINQEGKIKFVTANRILEVDNTTQAEFTANQQDVYVRVEAHKGDEILFSNPFMWIGTGKRLVTNRAILV